MSVSARASCTLLLLSTLTALVAAQGEETADMSMAHSHAAHHGTSATTHTHMDSHYPNLPSYFSHSQHSGLIYGHIVLMLLSWVIVLPLAVMLSIARSRLTILLQCVFLLVNGLGLLTGTVYNAKTPDLYTNNAHHKAGWAITWIALAWALMGLVKLLYAARGKRQTAAVVRPSIQPVSRAAMAEHQKHQKFSDLPSLHRYRWSHDSGHGTEYNSDSVCSSSRTSSWHSDSRPLPAPQEFNQLAHQETDEREEEEEEEEEEQRQLLDAGEKRGFLTNSTADRFLSRAAPSLLLGRVGSIFTVLYIILERFMPLLAFLGLLTGFVTFGGIARGNNVFNVLAHLIKGGIFFWYGLLTFGRWMGCFAEVGWAWNVKPAAAVVGRRTARVPTAEFTESFVIFLYGASNVFLEHLAAWGKPWTAMDLEHISITIMFFGGGLLGMLIESTAVRRLLSATLSGTDKQPVRQSKEWESPKSYTHSLNPMPGLVILLLGIMMSSHTQHSAVSTAVHGQWGTLFAGFALARGLTYVMFWLKPPTGYLPTRPPTEIITSFCLISGGMIFMASNKDTIHALEVFDLDAMFVFTVTMGLTALIMAWTVLLIAVKCWAVQRPVRTFARDVPSAA